MLGIISKNTILKAFAAIVKDIEELGIISKNTILKAIHNFATQSLQLCYVGNHK